MNRPRRNLPAVLAFPLTMIVSSVLVSGCGGDKLSDDAYGFIDLAPYYYDGSSAANPSAGLPREIAPTRGWMNGSRAEFYDFGLVGVTKKRSDGKLPDYAAISPMYFFYDDAGNPLTSNPVYENRTGLWHMRGGKGLLNINPCTNCVGPERKPAPKNVPYSVRVRDYQNDGVRGVPDYQRPIVDILQHSAAYSGLWEIWEVTAPGGYEPDAIKSYATLKKGIDDGSFLVRRTQKVINCPVLDDRQYVVPTALQYGIPRPRIEIWYRTKQGSCFLSDGWLALGNPPNPDPAVTTKFTLYKANTDGRRLNMFDVISYTIGSGNGARTTLTAPVSRIFTPTVKVATLDTRGTSDVRYTGDNVVEQATPKMNGSDPPGYRPIRWLWDLSVPQDPPYVAATFKSVAQMDPVQMSNRLASNVPFTKNIPLIGAYTKCTTNDDCAPLLRNPGIELECYQLSVANGGTGIHVKHTVPAQPADAPVQAGPVTDGTASDEPGGMHCNVKRVRFGEFCAPGIAHCAMFQPSRADPPPMAMGMPGKPYEPPPTEEETAINQYNKDNGSALIGGYTCQPNTAQGGYCMFRCNNDVTAVVKTAEKVAIKYKGPDGQLKTETADYVFDHRCGNIPGYRCLTPTGSGIPARGRVCMRTCDTGKPDTFNDEYCARPVNMVINDKVQDNVSLQRGTKCSNRGVSGGAGCQWDPAYEPRDPATNLVP